MRQDLFQWFTKTRDLRLVLVKQFQALLRIVNDRLELLIDFVDYRNCCLTSTGRMS